MVESFRLTSNEELIGSKIIRNEFYSVHGLNLNENLFQETSSTARIED